MSTDADGGVVVLEEPNVYLLGPLAVRTPTGPVAVAGLSARLLIELCVGGPTVSLDRLTAALWPDALPASAGSAFRVHLARLRRVLDPSPLTVERSASGLALVGARLDVDLFEHVLRRAGEVWRLAHTSRDQPAGPDRARLDRAAGELTAVKAMWRGEPFAPFSDDPALAAAVHRLRSRLADAQELAADLDLELGRHMELIPDLEQAVEDHPFRERRWERLMVAQYRAGRQQDALATFTRARTTLLEALGVDPGPGLAAVHEAILRQDAALLDPVDGTPSGAHRLSGASFRPSPAAMPANPPLPMPAGWWRRWS